MSYVDFGDLTPAQRAEALVMRPKWEREEFQRFAFWLKPDGHLSRRFGHHRLTNAAGAEIDAMLRGKPVRSKGDMASYVTAKFGLTP